MLLRADVDCLRISMLAKGTNAAGLYMLPGIRVSLAYLDKWVRAVKFAPDVFLVCISLQEGASIEFPDIVNLRGVYDV